MTTRIGKYKGLTFHLTEHIGVAMRDDGTHAVVEYKSMVCTEFSSKVPGVHLFSARVRNQKLESDSQWWCRYLAVISDKCYGCHEMHNASDPDQDACDAWWEAQELAKAIPSAKQAKQGGRL